MLPSTMTEEQFSTTNEVCVPILSKVTSPLPRLLTRPVYWMLESSAGIRLSAAELRRPIAKRARTEDTFLCPDGQLCALLPLLSLPPGVGGRLPTSVRMATKGACVAVCVWCLMSRFCQMWCVRYFVCLCTGTGTMVETSKVDCFYRRPDKKRQSCGLVRCVIVPILLRV